MNFVDSTIIAFLFVLWVFWKGPYVGILALFAAIPFGMMAAVNLPAVGNTSLMTYDLVLLMLGLLLLFRVGVDRNVGQLLGRAKGGLPLLLFFAYAIIATLFFPRIFAGETEVFSIGRVEGQIGIVSRPLAPGGGNLSQLVRMFLGVLAFAIPAVVMIRTGAKEVAFKAIVLLSGLHAFLGILDILTQMTGTSFIMEPIRTANYALVLGQELNGINRVLGGYPEPSSYGYVALGMFGFWLGYWYYDKSDSKLPGFMVLIYLLMILRITSSSAYVGAALLVCCFIALRLVEAVSSPDGKLDRRLVFAIIGLVAFLPILIFGPFLLYSLSPDFASFIDRSLLNKLSSDSGVERMSWNVQAIRNFWDTNMLGAGLGSVRASNWIAAVLGTTGIIGMVLLVTFLWQVFRIPVHRLPSDTRVLAMALKMGIAGCLCRALVVKASPNLDYVVFAMAGLLVGLFIHATSKPAAKRTDLSFPGKALADA